LHGHRAVRLLLLVAERPRVRLDATVRRRLGDRKAERLHRGELDEARAHQRERAREIARARRTRRGGDRRITGGAGAGVAAARVVAGSAGAAGVLPVALIDVDAAAGA